MRIPLALLAALGASLVLAACGDDGRPSGPVGNDSAFVGGPCMDATECDSGLCESEARFPGSLCTLSCGGSGDCPSGSSCAALVTGWVCVVSCAVSEECREQWVCDRVPEAGTGGATCVTDEDCGDTQVCLDDVCRGTTSVCIGPAPAP